MDARLNEIMEIIFQDRWVSGDLEKYIKEIKGKEVLREDDYFLLGILYKRYSKYIYNDENNNFMNKAIASINNYLLMCEISDNTNDQYYAAGLYNKACYLALLCDENSYDEVINLLSKAFKIDQSLIGNYVKDEDFYLIKENVNFLRKLFGLVRFTVDN